MKLIKLSCDQSSFRTLTFNSSGLTIILGTKANSEENKSSSMNGVGKTQALRLISFCLGAKYGNKSNNICYILKHAVPTWVFKLEFSIKQKKHIIERSGDSSTLRLDGEKISHTKLLEWLKSSGIFPGIDQYSYVTFRSLFSRFARVEKADCLDALSTNSEQEYSSLINNAYLMNLDLSLIENKYQIKNKIKANGDAKKLLKQDSYLSDIFRSNANPVGKKSELENKILDLEFGLENFSIAENYHDVEKQANELSDEKSKLTLEISSLKFKIDEINKSIAITPDINYQELMGLYDGLQQLFKPEAIEHFENVDKFHTELTINRHSRLEKEKIATEKELSQISLKLNETSKERDEKLLFLKKNRALDEFLLLSKELSTLQDELKQLEKYISIDEDIKLANLDLKKDIIDVVASALAYCKTDPLKSLNSKFQEITKVIYPKLFSGLFLSVIESDKNQKVYDFILELETDSSDGVADVKVLAYDWLIYHYGFHKMDMLWHDNRLFSDIDPEDLANWFKFVTQQLEDKEKQYIVSLNSNNYEDMLPYLSEELRQQLENSKIIELLGDNSKNKLLGKDFDKPRTLS